LRFLKKPYAKVKQWNHVVGYPLEKEEMVEEGELKLAVENRTEKKK
jgi:hypothetical protein